MLLFYLRHCLCPNCRISHRNSNLYNLLTQYLLFLISLYILNVPSHRAHFFNVCFLLHSKHSFIVIAFYIIQISSCPFDELYVYVIGSFRALWLALFLFLFWIRQSDVIKQKKAFFMYVINLITRTIKIYRKERKLKFCGTIHWPIHRPPSFHYLHKLLNAWPNSY